MGARDAAYGRLSRILHSVPHHPVVAYLTARGQRVLAMQNTMSQRTGLMVDVTHDGQYIQKVILATELVDGTVGKVVPDTVPMGFPVKVEVPASIDLIQMIETPLLVPMEGPFELGEGPWRVEVTHHANAVSYTHLTLPTTSRV